MLAVVARIPGNTTLPRGEYSRKILCEDVGSEKGGKIG